MKDRAWPETLCPALCPLPQPTDGLPAPTHTEQPGAPCARLLDIRLGTTLVAGGGEIYKTSGKIGAVLLDAPNIAPETALRRGSAYISGMRRHRSHGRIRSLPMSGAEGHATFAEILRGLRQRAGLSQAALAKRADLSPRSIKSLESGAHQPYFDTLQRLARALDLSESLHQQ